MIHVWLIKPQSRLRVWDSTTEKWAVIESWQALQNAPMVKANDKEVCLYLSTQSVLSLGNELNASQVKQLGVTGQQYLFEDIALTPVEQLRVRNISQGVQQFFYAFGAGEVEQWQQRLQLVGFKLVSLLPDFVLLPVPESRLGSEVMLYQDNIEFDNTLIVRQSEAQGMAISHVYLLPRLLSTVDEITYLSCNIDANNHHLNGSVSDSSVSENSVSSSTSHSATGIPQSFKQITDDNDIVVTLSKYVPTPVTNPTKQALNFVEVTRKRLASPYLALAASLLLLAGGTQILADLIASYQYEQAAIATREANNAQFATWFANESLNPSVNVVSQVQPRLIKGGSGTQVQLTTLNRISPIIKQSNLTAQSITWNDNSISLTVKGASRDNIDQMQRVLSDQNIAINLGAVNPTNDGGVIGEINIPLDMAATSGS